MFPLLPIIQLVRSGHQGTGRENTALRITQFRNGFSVHVTAKTNHLSLERPRGLKKTTVIAISESDQKSYLDSYTAGCVGNDVYVVRVGRELESGWTNLVYSYRRSRVRLISLVGVMDLEWLILGDQHVHIVVEDLKVSGRHFKFVSSDQKGYSLRCKIDLSL